MAGLSGVASGIDTNAIVEQLMALDRRSTTRIRLDQARVAGRDTGLKDVQSKLSALRSAAQALRAPELWADKQTVESSNPVQVAVERLSGAGTGATSIRVVSLAASSQRTYTFAATAATRTFSIMPNSGSAVDVTVAAGASLDDVVSAINGKSDSPVFAAAVRTDPNNPASARLVLSSRATGAASGFTLADDGVGATDVAGTARVGKNAMYFLDGDTDPATVRSSASNTVDNAVAGLRLTLKGVTTADVNLTVGPPAPDAEAAKTKVKAFVEAYNAVVLTARAKMGDKAIRDPASAADAARGQLFGDRGLSTLVNGLRRGSSDAVAGNATGTDELLDLGISTGAIGAGRSASSGTLTINDAKLTAKLLADPRAVQRLLGGVAGVDGVAQRVQGLVEQEIGPTDALDNVGTIDQRLKSSVNEQRRLDDAIVRNERRLGLKEKHLKTQFAAMESALQASQTQQSWLSGQISSMYAR